jgi:hypothetical protein
MAVRRVDLADDPGPDAPGPDAPSPDAPVATKSSGNGAVSAARRTDRGTGFGEPAAGG